MKFEDMADLGTKMRIGVALEHTLRSARETPGLSHKGRRDYLVTMLAFEGLSEDEIAVGLEYVERRHKLTGRRP